LFDLVNFALEREPQNWQLYSYKAHLLGKENPKKAIKTLSQGLAVLHQTNDKHEDITWAYLRIAEHLGILGSHKQSIAACNLALDTYIEEDMKNIIYKFTYKLRAEQYIKLNQKNSARSDLIQALSYSPDNKEILEMLREMDGYQMDSNQTKK
jgi:tetratricopeptide (TPR) repeat protein